MGEFKIVEQQEITNYVTTEERLWLTADREQIVPEGDPGAAFLFATPSDRISRDDAIRYGLVSATKDEQKAAAAAAADDGYDQEQGEPEDLAGDVDATDGAAQVAAEHELDLAAIEGTGKDGRITKGDVEKALAASDGA